ncbi:hypothetical protein E4U55_006408 [Claviceps digitariae]|nr:hypothetical protein E4U55_006408 [Claviceps digitariae]
MYFTQTIFAALLAASSAMAAPAAVGKSMMAAAVPDWIFEGVSRNCGPKDDQCTVTFNINPQDSGRTWVSFVTDRNGAVGASQNSGAAQTFGDYTITSGWSGQFGPGNGFTTFAVVNNKNRLITYPSYTDVQLANGNTVTPNQSYKPQNLS